MPEVKIKAFLKAFAKLKQRVLWKWEKDSLSGKPQNVKTGKWLPQTDILGKLQLCNAINFHITRNLIFDGVLTSVTEASLWEVNIVYKYNFHKVYLQNSFVLKMWLGW